MIRVSRLDGTELVLNAHLIEIVEAVPDTVISLTTGRKLVVRESVNELVERVLAYRRSIWPDWAETVACNATPEGN